jgi:hypothetical protein
MRDLHTDMPWASLRSDLKMLLDKTIIAHTPQLKLSGELHEATGSGFVEGRGTIYRQTLAKCFGKTNDKIKAEKILKAIVDPTVAKCIEVHLQEYQYDAQRAFAQGVKVLHRNGTTEIKRVRVYQSMQIKKEEDLKKEKFAARDKQGEIFKWYTYGNLHHVEILKEDGVVEGRFVTMMEAHRRAMTGTKSAIKRGVKREDIVNKQHGDNIEFVMAVHKQDMVSLEINGKRQFYCVQSLGQISQDKLPRLTLVPHTLAETKEKKDQNDDAKKLKGKEAKAQKGIIDDSVRNLIAKYDMKLHKVNVLGKLL